MTNMAGSENEMSPAMDTEAQTVLEDHFADQAVRRSAGAQRCRFAVRDGEVLGLIGPNGAGKTTLLESIAGLLPVDSGRIFWRGRPLPAQRRREAIFYLPDGIRPYGDQFVEEVLAFFAGTYRRSAAGMFPTSLQPSGSGRCW